MTTQICILKIKENIQRVENGEALTLPLRELKRDCRFEKFYNDFFDIKNAEKRKMEKRAYYQKPEVKAHQKAYHKAYHQRPEVKAYHKAYKKAYYQRPEVKAHQKAYHKAYHQNKKAKLQEIK